MEKHKKKKSNKKLILILDGVLVLAVLAAAVVLIVTLSGGKKQTLKPDALNAAAASESTEGELTEGGTSAPAGAPVVWNSDSEVPLSVDFAQLTAANPEVVGWLYGEGTGINYAVMQNVDNDYYMTRNADGQKSDGGALCLDSRNSPEIADAHLVIYGNAMADGSMFGSLVNYRDQSFLDSNPTLYLLTKGKNFRMDVFAAYTASSAMSNYPIWFLDNAARTEYINQVKKNSLVSAKVDIPSGAMLLSLATNLSGDSDTRFVVCGVLTEVA